MMAECSVPEVGQSEILDQHVKRERQRWPQRRCRKESASVRAATPDRR